MSTIDEHYEKLLSKHYTWMFGLSFEEKVGEQKKLLLDAIQRFTNGSAKQTAVDLGCGSGFQSVALAQLGFSPVIAIDSSGELLAELKSHAHDLPVQTIHGDMRNLSKVVRNGAASVVVCMGDTLSHLSDKAEVAGLFRAAIDALQPGGLFILTYRDLTTELTGTDRFIPVRSDQNTVMTCFLEYPNSETVIVHDLVYTREQDGWSLNKSSYPKLRLGIEWVAQALTASGFTIEENRNSGRFLEVVAKKP